MRTMIIPAGLAALTLAACGQAGDAEKKADATATAKATATADAGFGEGPKPGLWRVTTQISGLPAGAAPPVTETCVTEATFKRPEAPMEDMKGMACEEQTFRREGDVIVGHMACTMGENMRSEQTIRISGDLDRRYTMEVKQTMTPAPSPEMAATTLTMTAERLGDCPASPQ